ncbi:MULTISPECIES: hypothetical protein [unclassified Bradyrhizobium]|uniref:hypothetical protein n=1 Tax=unclassified Bradyrhizobium TaxID=2631580 RepID=UPI0028EDDF24|nr:MULTISPECIES: hypothetical protein [unclassified Bradyrhizobium]
MTALTKAFHKAFSEASDSPKHELLKQFLLLCAAILLVSAMALTYGTDLSHGFF